MTLTLAVLASMLILLPGLTFLGVWNLKGANSGAGRPELPLASVTTLLIAVGVSLLAHFMGWIIVEAVRTLAIQLGAALPGKLWAPLELLLRPDGAYQPVFRNPLDAMVGYADGGHLRMMDLIAFGALMLLESMLVASFINNDGFDLVFDGIDLNGQGWVYQHYVRPSQHGYGPIGYVLTTYQQNDLGVGYIGTIADIRHSEKGQLLSIALLNPDRVLFELKPAVPAKLWGAEAVDPRFVTFSREPLGGIVALDAGVVANLLVRTVEKEVLDDIATEVAKAEAEAEGATAASAAPSPPSEGQQA